MKIIIKIFINFHILSFWAYFEKYVDRYPNKKKKIKDDLSFDLIENISDTLKLGKQIILFQNRRGYAPILECLTCGHTPQCVQCDVTLTYHKNSGKLQCHYSDNLKVAAQIKVV